VRCPECGKVYVVPEPKPASVPADLKPMNGPAALIAELPAPRRPFAAPPIRPASSAVDDNQPRLAVDSPLPELALLDPPRAAAAATPRRSSAGPTSTLPVTGPTAPRRYDQEATQTTLSPRVPQMPYGAADADDESLGEVQERIATSRRRMMVNLIVFAVGIVVMTIFAFIVIRFSRSA
jgi:hypothetical protein